MSIQPTNVMACFTRLPNEILENIFKYLDLKNHVTLSLVCSRWNNILMSERYLKKHVVLHIEGGRVMDAKLIFRRKYDALSLKLDNQNANKMMKNLKLVDNMCPYPLYLRIENLSTDKRFGWMFEEIFFSHENLEELHIVGTCKTEKGKLCVSFGNLKKLKIEAFYADCFRLYAPKLNEFHLLICSQNDLDLLAQFCEQLRKLTAVFSTRDLYYFYNMDFPKLTELTIERVLKGMTRSEQDISIAFFEKLSHLTKLHLTVKFIDSYVMQMISCSIPNLKELKLEVSEGTIELSNISKLKSLEKLMVAAEKINLLDAYFPKLVRLELGTVKYGFGTYVNWFERLMLLDNMGTLALNNVKFYPEVLRLTPSYSLERLYITNYKRVSGN
ncbi:uncharacterized protein LOC129767360 isoform X2 [Toxorhynchites rutilus septentrionalis]|uniref:uncharacterized protein LOC129767360 isoform X2 n=1 Tax=Toxorhynchites rutilus septentrionalis TaxID=329112 RepID=UPI00247A6B6A|nr:uncharacterized protein LOC129767360 isoform X2 [Toxorhynchites rutilus septentrionalis]